MAEKYSATKNLERFMSKVKDTGDCWLWTGAVGSGGYGQFISEKKVGRAHRWAYEFFVGKIPDGLVIDHLCFVKSCVNPKHLEAVTQQVNIKRWAKTQRKKTHCLRGHPLLNNTYISVNRYGTTSGSCKTCKKTIRQRRKLKETPNED